MKNVEKWISEIPFRGGGGQGISAYYFSQNFEIVSLG